MKLNRFHLLVACWTISGQKSSLRSLAASGMRHADKRYQKRKKDILRERNEGYEEERGRIRKTEKRKEENKTH